MHFYRWFFDYYYMEIASFDICKRKEFFSYFLLKTMRTFCVFRHEIISAIFLRNSLIYRFVSLFFSFDHTRFKKKKRIRLPRKTNTKWQNSLPLFKISILLLCGFCPFCLPQFQNVVHLCLSMCVCVVATLLFLPLLCSQLTTVRRNYKHAQF